jgi:hypothetical protein
MGDRDAALCVDIPHANTQREPSPDSGVPASHLPQALNAANAMCERRYPPPCSVTDENDACFIVVNDKDGKSLAYVSLQGRTGPASGDETDDAVSGGAFRRVGAASAGNRPLQSGKRHWRDRDKAVTETLQAGPRSEQQKPLLRGAS